MLVQQTNIYSIMQETYISIDEVVDRILSHPDVKQTGRAHNMLLQLGTKQDNSVDSRKPRQHIIKSKQQKR